MAGDAVALRSVVSPSLARLGDRARYAVSGPGQGVDRALRLARELGSELPVPGHGHTLILWESLATLGAVDLTVARVVEPHLDALSILHEARRDGDVCPGGRPPDAVWGVYAAEGGGRLLASSHRGTWTLTGAKPWCSLADQVSHALVTAWVDDERRGLFAVHLAHPGVRPQEWQKPWVSRGLAEVRSTGLSFEVVPASPVGEPGWYLERPGFAWGGIGVAAIWFGGAVAVARRVRKAASRRTPDQVGLSHLGAVDVALTRARAVLLEAATVVDRPGATTDEAGRLALRVRQVVADSVEEVLARAGHALGPAPLAQEEEHARRVADLMVYVRQHHAERDAASLGSAVLGAAAEAEWSWW